MKLVADTNIFLAVALGEPERPKLIQLTADKSLVAPSVLPFEVGNALSALLKKGLLEKEEVLAAWDAVQGMAVDLRPVDIRSALKISIEYGIYAYDAYFLECAFRLSLPILTLDNGMKRLAERLNIEILE